MIDVFLIVLGLLIIFIGMVVGLFYSARIPRHPGEYQSLTFAFSGFIPLFTGLILSR
jgi:hypothetical protein